MRPRLNEGLSPETFQEFRWLKGELIDFCEQRGISTEGNKHSLKRRVAGYLAARRAVDRSRRS